MLFDRVTFIMVEDTIMEWVNFTSLPYFGVKLSCVCLMFAYRKKIAYSYPKVIYSYPNVTLM